jgi:hypothetical protein
MGTLAYSRCVECDEEKFFSDGLRCARCLGLSYRSIDEEESEDNAEVSSQVSMEPLAA